MERRVSQKRTKYIRKTKRYSKPRPQKSLYDNDAWIKVQRIIPLKCATGGEAYQVMRTDIASSTAVDFTYLDIAEYQPYAKFLYAYAEVRGMKIEFNAANFSGSGNQSILGVRFFGGSGINFPVGSLPDENKLCGAFGLGVGNGQGQKCSQYFNVNRALRNAGMPQSSTSEQEYDLLNGYALCLFVKHVNFNPGDQIGFVTQTFYIRMHQRKALP